MTVTDVRKDPANRTFTITSTFDAPIERVWQVWADPRQLERWWGPPTYPATVTSHDLRPGGRVTYFMTGPEGDTPGGWWEVVAVDAPRRLEFDDGFADADGNPSEDGPVTHAVVTLEEDGGKTTMTLTSSFPSTEVMEQMLSMGMEEGITGALGQVDDLLRT
jgi:uncharacterized protein YndB with AHSA1/START domain